MLAAETNLASALPVENLTLEQALEMAERRQPQLAEARALVEAAAGRAKQAGAFPNPEAIVGAQQIPFSSDSSNQREYIAGIAQPIPLGGRLGKAREAELLDREVRVRGLEATRRGLRKKIHSAFATALYQEKAFQTQSQIAQSVEKVAAMTKARVDAGDAVPEELARVEMEFARAKVEVQRSQSMREQAMLVLAVAIGDSRLSVKSLAGSLDTAFEIPTLESLAANLSAQPEFALADASLRANNARIDLAKAERIPDVKVEALYHRLEATKENTFDIGLSIPLPLFNRNQGNVLAASRRADQARDLRNAAELRLRTETRQALDLWQTANTEVRSFNQQILPAAQSAVDSATRGFEMGKFNFLDVLDAQRTLIAARTQYLAATAQATEAWVRIERIYGDLARF